MRARRAAIIVASALLACRTRPAPERAAAIDATGAVAPDSPDSAFDMLWQLELRLESRLGPARAEAIEQLGTPLRVAAWQVEPSAGWPDLDSTVRLTYPAYELAYLITKDHRELLGEITLLTQADTLVPGIAVGAPRSALLGRFPTPDTSFTRGDTTIIRYSAPSAPDQERIDFITVRDTIRRIAFRPWID